MGGKVVENVAKMCLEWLPKFCCVKHVQGAQSCLSLKKSLTCDISGTAFTLAGSVQSFPMPEP